VPFPNTQAPIVLPENETARVDPRQTIAQLRQELEQRTQKEVQQAQLIADLQRENALLHAKSSDSSQNSWMSSMPSSFGYLPGKFLPNNAKFQITNLCRKLWPSFQWPVWPLRSCSRQRGVSSSGKCLALFEQQRPNEWAYQSGWLQ
jgi:hypothetical protein